MIEARDNRRFEGMRRVADVIRWHQAGATRLESGYITEGGANWFDDAFWLPIGSEEILVNSGRDHAENNFLRRYNTVDWTFLVRIVVSFLCIVLAYDTLSGEHERGTLRLVLVSPISRAQLLAGKILAHLTVLMTAVGLGVLVSLLVMSLGGAVRLDSSATVGVLLFLAGTAVYGMLFLLLAAAVSALTRHSASSLVVLLLVWAVLIVMIPQTSYLIGTNTVEGIGRWRDSWDTAANVTRNRLLREGVVLRGREAGAIDDYALERRYAAAMESALEEDERTIRAMHAQSVVQYKRARSVNLLSPGFAYQYSIETLLGTGALRYIDLLEQVWAYRRDLRDFVRARDAADPESPHVLFLADYVSQREIDPENVPRFAQRGLTFAEALAAGRTPVILLVLETLAAFVIALWAANRMRVAG